LFGNGFILSAGEQLDDGKGLLGEDSRGFSFGLQ